MVCGGDGDLVHCAVPGNEPVHLEREGAERAEGEVYTASSDGLYFLGFGGVQWVVY